MNNTRFGGYTMFKKMILAGSLFVFLCLGAMAQPAVAPRDGAWDRLVEAEKKPIAYPLVKESDVLWSMRVWQVIDLREKMNQPMYFPPSPSGNMRSLMQVIWDGIEEGDITPYHVDYEDFSVPVSKQELLNLLQQTQTITLERPYPPYEQYDTTITITFNTSDILRFRIKEDWFFDTRRSVLDVRILGICPVREAVDPITGETRGDEPLFWVYFPEARNVMVNAPVFNRNNDARRMSYDDLFIRRYFSSVIYKASNVFDRRIGEQFQGRDALLEAQRIKDMIRNYEHDLWEF